MGVRVPGRGWCVCGGGGGGAEHEPTPVLLSFNVTKEIWRERKSKRASAPAGLSALSLKSRYVKPANEILSQNDLMAGGMESFLRVVNMSSNRNAVMFGCRR